MIYLPVNEPDTVTAAEMEKSKIEKRIYTAALLILEKFSHTDSHTDKWPWQNHMKESGGGYWGRKSSFPMPLHLSGLLFNAHA